MTFRQMYRTALKALPKIDGRTKEARAQKKRCIAAVNQALHDLQHSRNVLNSQLAEVVEMTYRD